MTATAFQLKKTMTDLRWTALECPDGGTAYVDLREVIAVGPQVQESIAGQTHTMRLLYLRGGMGVAIKETVANLQELFETAGIPS